MKIKYIRVCEFCGTSFTGKNSNKRYCGKRCKDNASKVRRGIKPTLEPTVDRKVVCKGCGVEFTTSNTRKQYCSKKCCDFHYRHLKAEEQKEQKEQKQKQKLQEKREKEIKKEEEKKQHIVQRTCEWCGKAFTCYDYQQNKTCSKECQKKRQNRYKDKRIPKEQRKDRISLKRLYVRDGGRCYICGCQCSFEDWKLSKNGNRYPGETYPEIEHVIPIAKGGMNSWDNVRLSCHRCNHIKADGIIEVEPMTHEFAISKRFTTSAKKTAQYSENGELIKIWDLTAEIERTLGLNCKHIQNVCRGDRSKTKRAYGFKWEYVSTPAV